MASPLPLLMLLLLLLLLLLMLLLLLLLVLECMSSPWHGSVLWQARQACKHVQPVPSHVA